MIRRTEDAQRKLFARITSRRSLAESRLSNSKFAAEALGQADSRLEKEGDQPQPFEEQLEVIAGQLAEIQHRMLEP